MAVSPGGATRYPRPMTSPASEENRPMPGAPNAAPDVADTPRQAVGYAFACIRCDYDLCGVSTDTACPECGTSVKHSLANTFPVKHASPEYIALLYWGSVLVLAAWAWDIFVHVVGIHWSLKGQPAEWFIWTYFNLGIAVPFVYLVGWWLLSWPQSTSLDHSSRGSRRRLVRLAVYFCLGVSAARFIMELPGVLPSALASTGAEPMYRFSTVTMWAGIAGNCVLFFVSTMHAGQLGRRIPSKRVVAWAGPVLWFVPFLRVAGQLALVGPFPGVVNNLFSIVLQIVACSLCLVMFYWLRADLQKIREAARPEFK